MPLYEYECRQCHGRIEKIQKFSDPELTVCPRCGGSLERTLTAPNVQFKGSGWYKDLYSSAKPSAADSGAGGEAGAKAAPADSSPAPAGGSPSSAASPSAAPATAPATAAPAPAAGTSKP